MSSDVRFVGTQSTPLFVQEWTTPAKPTQKKFRNAATGVAERPVVALAPSVVFEGFTIHDSATALIDPFPCEDSLAYVQSLYPKMPVRPVSEHALEKPPDYANTWIVTCVPHGISTDPRGIALLQRYKETDFFKCFFHSLLYSPWGCAGGWLVVPLAFFVGLNDTGLRYSFLSRYAVTSVHLFDKPVLRDDPCVYISFCFHRSEEMLTRQLVSWSFLGETRLFPVNKDTDWILCSDLYQLRRTVELKRYFTNSEDTPTCLVLHATDAVSCGGRISMTYEPHKQYASTTSRNISTLVVLGCTLTEKEQRTVAEEFTVYLEQLRSERWSLFLSPMEETGNSRRRIPFKLAFVIAAHIVSRVLDSRTKSTPLLE